MRKLLPLKKKGEPQKGGKGKKKLGTGGGERCETPRGAVGDKIQIAHKENVLMMMGGRAKFFSLGLRGRRPNNTMGGLLDIFLFLFLHLPFISSVSVSFLVPEKSAQAEGAHDAQEGNAT